MMFQDLINILLNPAVLLSAVFLVVGLYQAVQKYKRQGQKIKELELELKVRKGLITRLVQATYKSDNNG